MLKLKVEFLINSSVTIFRSSHWSCSIQKTVFKNLAIFTGKQLCWSVFFNIVADLQACNFIKGTPTQGLPFEYHKNFKNTYLEEQLQMNASEFSKKIPKNLFRVNFLRSYHSD